MGTSPVVNNTTFLAGFSFGVGKQPRSMFDGCQDSTELPPSMQYKTLYRTIQHLESRNHQSNDWQTNRVIPRHGHVLLRSVPEAENPD